MVLGARGIVSDRCLFYCSLFSSSVAAFVSPKFYWSSSVAFATGLGHCSCCLFYLFSQREAAFHVGPC